MLYHHQRSVPKDTNAPAFDIQKMKITRGIIDRWIVVMPVECADLMQFQVEYHGAPVFPRNKDGWVKQGLSGIGISDNIRIDDSPFTLDIIAFNDDDTYAHEYNLYVNVVTEEPLDLSMPSSAGLLEKFRSIFGGD